MSKDDALNALARMFHNAEEMGGEDGLVMVVDLALWNEGCEAIETLIGGEEDDEEMMESDPFCNCSAGHGIEEMDFNKCDCCGKPIEPEEVGAVTTATEGPNAEITGG